MNTFFEEIQQTIFPKLDGKDGPLPPLLIALTIVTGLVDSFSYLVLSHVFVANMTGNVVFLAFALAGAKEFSILSSFLAIVAFFVGSLAGGLISSRMGANRGRLASASTTLQFVLVAIALLISLISAKQIPSGYAYGLITSLAISMGIQNSASRKLAVPDLTTTVLTLTMTGIGADAHLVGGSGSKAGRRLLSIASMFLGAFIGTLFILYVSNSYPLLIALTLVGIVAVAVRYFSKGSPAWVHSK
jgi:uncharacterized membrane protein YoaK (UPF0700 family)